MHFTQLAQRIKVCWISAGNPPENPIEKIPLAVQQLGDQLAIVPLCHPVTSGGAAPVEQQSEGAAAEESCATAPDEGAVRDTANAGSEDYWSGKSALDTEVLFSQQFQLQQRLEDLRQEMIGLFGGQQRYLQNMNTNVRRIAMQPNLFFV